MPTKEEHEVKASRNTSFAGELIASHSQYSEWIITVVFYAALHLVDSFLATKGIHPPDHHARDQEVRKFLRPHYSTYRSMKNDSIEARYDVVPFGQPDVEKQVANLGIIRKASTTG